MAMLLAAMDSGKQKQQQQSLQKKGAAAAAAAAPAWPRWEARTGSSDAAMRQACKRVLVENDRGGYSIPTKGLYPYQWNCDSAFVSMGLAELEGYQERSWSELRSLLSAQWSDGMVPHIVFHDKLVTSYFPGPEVWGSPESPMQSSGITQPPLAATAARRILEAAPAAERAAARAQAAELFPRLLSWHRWFHTARDPRRTGLVATIHPWETGMDNSPAWDAPITRAAAAMATSKAGGALLGYERRDLGHVSAAMRPHRREYDVYISLLAAFRASNYDSQRVFDETAFRVTDLCTNCLLHRADADLLWLASAIGGSEAEAAAAEIRSWIAASAAAFDELFDATAGIYKCKDQLTGELLPAATSAGFLPLYAGVASQQQAAALAATLREWLDVPGVQFAVPSCDPRRQEEFEALRYWRGPVWLVVNWLIAQGLSDYGFHSLAQRLRRDSYELVAASGFAEYFCPLTGTAAGGNAFSWTAAVFLAWILKNTTEIHEIPS